jgi:hypothetical protein
MATMVVMSIRVRRLAPGAGMLEPINATKWVGDAPNHLETIIGKPAPTAPEWNL